MGESSQHVLTRVRPPRVKITYDVEIGNAIEKKELPYLIGVLADLSGKPEKALPPLKERKFVEIDRDNFNDVLASVEPRLTYRVPNRLAGEGELTSVELKFHHIDDFEPMEVVRQVPALNTLLEARQRLRDLLAKLDGNDSLDALLREVTAKADEQKALRALLGGGDGAAPAAAAPAAPAEEPPAEG
jgi:type VI secretion system protein ImpB